MKTVTFYTVVLSVILGFGACATAKMDKELAKQIRSDERLKIVSAKAEELIQNGLNAGDSYNEIWIRDSIGVIWEFFEFGMDQLFGFDMQKDAIVHSISSVMLDPTHTNHAIRINDITQVTVNGQDLGLGGYLDIGLIDTMEDLVVNFIGAVVFSVFGFLYVKNRGKKDSIISRFVPRRKSADRDYLRLVIDGGSRESHTNMRDTVIEQTFDCPDKLDA